jgi:hypothetical protein
VSGLLSNGEGEHSEVGRPHGQALSGQRRAYQEKVLMSEYKVKKTDVSF